jgi:hypothetical protein
MLFNKIKLIINPMTTCCMTTRPPPVPARFLVKTGGVNACQQVADFITVHLFVVVASSSPLSVFYDPQLSQAAED